MLRTVDQRPGCGDNLANLRDDSENQGASGSQCGVGRMKNSVTHDAPELGSEIDALLSRIPLAALYSVASVRRVRLAGADVAQPRMAMAALRMTLPKWAATVPPAPVIVYGRCHARAVGEAQISKRTLRLGALLPR